MQFDFGQNWIDYSRNAATDEKVAGARRDFLDLVDGMEFSGKSFLDIGFGQGLSLLVAQEAGARAFGLEVNPKCIDAIEENTRFFSCCDWTNLEIVQGSILDGGMVERLRAVSPRKDGFDIVHSWGVLHHTGNLRKAVTHAVSLVRPQGHLILAIYNRHWTSPLWCLIKWVYCKSPAAVRKLAIWFFYPVIRLAKLAVTGRNPETKERGMDFYYDLIDWLGGYPYEYASVREFDAYLRPFGFQNVKTISPEVPTGCNQLVYSKPQ